MYRVQEFLTLSGDWGYRVQERVWLFWLTVEKDRLNYQKTWWAYSMKIKYSCYIETLDGKKI